jgi:hypothetical protein
LNLRAIVAELRREQQAQKDSSTKRLASIAYCNSASTLNTLLQTHLITMCGIIGILLADENANVRCRKNVLLILHLLPPLTMMMYNDDALFSGQSNDL